MKGSGTHKEPLGHEHLRDECALVVLVIACRFLSLSRCFSLSLSLSLSLFRFSNTRSHTVTSRCLFRRQAGRHIVSSPLFSAQSHMAQCIGGELEERGRKANTQSAQYSRVEHREQINTRTRNGPRSSRLTLRRAYGRHPM